MVFHNISYHISYMHTWGLLDDVKATCLMFQPPLVVRRSYGHLVAMAMIIYDRQIISTSSINGTWSWSINHQYIIYEWDIISTWSISLTGSNPSPISSQSAPSHRGVVDHWDPPAAVSTASKCSISGEHGQILWWCESQRTQRIVFTAFSRGNHAFSWFLSFNMRISWQ